MKKQKRRTAAKVDQGSKLSVIQPDVAGIDIGSREMFVCGPADQQGRREMRVFATTTEQIAEYALKSTANQMGYSLVKQDAVSA